MPPYAPLSLTDLRVSGRGGVPVIPRPTPLTRLHYFDGKFLRAKDLTLEQEYHRQLVQFANQAGGTGVVHGFDAAWTGGDALALGPGLALDPQGRTLYLPEGVPLSLGQLVEASREGAVLLSGGTARAVRFAGFADCEPKGADGGTPTTDGGVLYLVTLFHAEDLCGTEDVLGKLCADACAGSTERPYILEGVLVRAVAVTLETALATSARVALTGKHLRSLVAAAYFEDERKAGGSLISGAGLRSDAWCLGAVARGGAGVPVGLFSRAGAAIRFFDAWTARRERMEPPNRRYWAGRMAMRPWEVFLAQVLQFQCQLSDCLGEHDPAGEDPCAPAYRLLRDTSETFTRWLGAERPEAGLAERLEEVTLLRGRLVDAVDGRLAVPRNRQLIACGFVELPSAGYLPVVPGSTLTVNQQVRRMMGEGVDLRFCVVRPDYVAHALEEAQHMDRISLLAGLDDPAKKPRVDVLVPDGVIEGSPGTVLGQGYTVDFGLAEGFVELVESVFDDTGFEPVSGLASSRVVSGPSAPGGVALPPDPSFALFGAGRGEDLPGGGFAFHFAGQTPSFGSRAVFTAAAAFTAGNIAVGPGVIVDPVPGRLPAALWLTVSAAADPFALPVHGVTRIDGEAFFHHLATSGEGTLEKRTLEARFHGELEVVARGGGAGDPRVAGTVEGQLLLIGHPPSGPPLTRSFPIREEILFDRRADRSVRMSIPKLQVFFRGLADLAVTREWPEAVRAQVEGSVVSRNGSRRPIFDLDQRENAEVGRPDHPAHASSIAALQRIGAELDQAGFAPGRARKLFPPAAPAADELVVKATRDWVLFHRRRDKTCGIDVTRPVHPNRRYRVFQIQIQRADIDPLLEALRDGRLLPGSNPRLAGIVEFTGGLPGAESPAAELRAAWDALTTDRDRILVGVIASQGDAEAEGPTLAEARLGTLTGIYAAVTPRDASARFEVLADPPPQLDVLGVDGVILVATFPLPTATECHTAYVLVENASLTPVIALHQSLGGNSFTDAMFARFQGRVAGSLAFVEGTAQPAGDHTALTAALPGSFRTVPNAMSLVALAVCNFDRTAAQQAVHLAQSDELARLLGARRLGTLVTTKPLPFGCPALTLLFLVKTSEIPPGGTGGGPATPVPGGNPSTPPVTPVLTATTATRRGSGGRRKPA